MVFYLRKTRPEEQSKGFQENPKTFIGRKLSRQKITGNFATNRKQNKIIVIQMFQTRISMLSLLHFAKIFSVILCDPEGESNLNCGLQQR